MLCLGLGQHKQRCTAEKDTGFCLPKKGPSVRLQDWSMFLDTLMRWGGSREVSKRKKHRKLCRVYRRMFLV
jgi:hypothetical protein